MSQASSAAGNRFAQTGLQMPRAREVPWTLHFPWQVPQHGPAKLCCCNHPRCRLEPRPGHGTASPCPWHGRCPGGVSIPSGTPRSQLHRLAAAAGERKVFGIALWNQSGVRFPLVLLKPCLLEAPALPEDLLKLHMCSSPAKAQRLNLSPRAWKKTMPEFLLLQGHVQWFQQN